MSEWLDNQKQSNSSIRQLLQERIEKANPRRILSAEEAKRLAKFETIAEKLKRGENVQNRQLLGSNLFHSCSLIVKDSTFF